MLAGLKKITPRCYRDERGFFLESYQKVRYVEEGIDLLFVQDNLSFSKKGVLRGLHFQETPGQAKLVTCLQGEILDVAVDIRLGSSTFGQWEAHRLDSVTHAQLFLPVGFAHGFLVLSDTALVQYKVSALYDPAAEKTIRWSDPDLAIAWGVTQVTVSERDRSAPFMKEIFPCAFG